ncbi:MAG: hypothetical protein N3D84_01810 [Candidatus Woesearchaeota archaeon]|nr:hypothetical protein [Candidatus Woesearchaeota archaeon]
MNNKGLNVFAVIVLFLLVMSILPICASAIPAWKKTNSKTPSQTATITTQNKTATQPVVQTKVYIINNTQMVATEKPWYKDWEFIGLVVVIISAIGGWIISRIMRSKTAKYMAEIDKIYNTYNLNANKCEAELVALREKIENDFKKGKINDQGLSLLESKIDKHLKSLRSDIVKRRFLLPDNLKKLVKEMLADGIITKEEYKHFKQILNKAELSAKDKEDLNRLMHKWKEEDKGE